MCTVYGYDAVTPPPPVCKSSVLRAAKSSPRPPALFPHLPLKAVSRTTAFETSMKSFAFGFLLATWHFKDPLCKVLAAISAVWVAVIGFCLAVQWEVDADMRSPWWGFETPPP